jgi:formylmethanofuran dehydrogenase subunit E
MEHTAIDVDDPHANQRKCDHCGLYVTEIDKVEEDGWVYCSHACQNAQQ